MTEETLRTGLPTGEERPKLAAGRDSEHLFVLLQADAPLLPPMRHALGDVDRVTFGRGDARTWSRRDEQGRRVLELRFPDARMSSSHAALTRDGDGWSLADVGSRNGTRVGGVARESVSLRDGDRFEIGRTQIRFRASLHDASGVVDGAPVTYAPGLATILPSSVRDLDVVRRLAPSRVPLVIEAETGCGKELMARAVHALSGRTGPLVAVNCGAIAPNLLESELFGYRKGAFSGASEDRAGLVRSAHQGTLFLDEIADLPPPAQTALLRVLQEGEVLPVGATRAVPVDVRVVVACQRPLRERVDAGTLRGDLLARIEGFTVRIPPLRERAEDLGLVVAALLRRLAPKDADRVTFSAAAADALLGYAWPYNVRELERALEAALVLAGEARRIDVDHLPEPLRATGGAPRGSTSSLAPPIDVAPVRLSRRDDVRRGELEALLTEHEGNVSAVARVTGKARAQIYRWLRQYGIDAQTFVR